MSNPNFGKLAFSRAITDIEGDFITSDVCHNYGIMSGCDEGCPALLDGDCRAPYDAIECCDFSDEEKADVLSLYSDKGEPRND